MEADDTAPPLTIRLFGPLEVRVNGQPLQRLRFRKSEVVLALCALRHGREVDRSWLSGLLWPESRDSQALRNCLSDLRRALGTQAGALQSLTPHTLRLDLTDADVDVVAFDSAIEGGDPGSLEEAVSLYRGPLLEGCCEEWVFQERQAREQAYLSARERLAALALERCETSEAERHLRLAVTADPLRESTQRALMQVLAASGNFAASLLVYRELRLRLHRELNAEPDAETQTLFQRLRSEGRRLSAKRPGARRATSVAVAIGDLVPSDARAPKPLPTGTVTFLFTDIEGSSQLWEEEPAAMRRALTRHDAVLRTSIEGNGGFVFKTVGDGFCAIFVTSEEAVEAALVAQRALSREVWGESGPLRVRMALHTGAAEEREGDYFGPPLNRVARLLDAGHGGQILLSLATQELAQDRLPEGVSLRDLGEHRLPGLNRPERIFQLVAPDLPAKFPPLRTPGAGVPLRSGVPNNLPLPLTRFIGREDQIAIVRQRLAAGRLVTVTGAGGCGKTRLAFEVARELLENNESPVPEGVWVVELASLADPKLVPQSVASALAVPEQRGHPLTETLVEAVRSRSLLLVLDNCEHLIDACAALAEALLRACPDLRVIATSREGLNVPGETVHRLPSLRVPAEKSVPLEALEQIESIQLFLDRARAVSPGFSLTAGNAAAVARVCRRLDGIPLAIELAAARIKALSVEQLDQRLDDLFRLLTGGARTALPRHQTLQALIDWSHNLLSEPERSLLRRLSVFAGGWTLEAVETVCGGAGFEKCDVLDLLVGLVEKSLVQYGEPSTAAGADEGRAVARYRLLETVRQYARDRLSESGEGGTLRKRHAEYFLALAEEVEPKLRSAAKKVWLEHLEGEHGNFRSALAWCLATLGSEQLAGDSLKESRSSKDAALSELSTIHSPLLNAVEIGLRLASALWWFWFLRDHWSEGRMWIESALARDDVDQRTLARAKALEGLVWLTSDCRYGEESVALFRELGDPLGLAGSLRSLGMRLTDLGDYTAARPLCEESLAICQQYGDRWGLIPSLWGLGQLAFQQRDYDTAESLWEQSLRVCREVGDQWNLSWSLNGLGRVAERRRDWAAARDYHQRSLPIFQELASQWGMVHGLARLAGVANEEGRPERAARLFGAVEAALEGMGTTMDPHERGDRDHYIGGTRATLDEEAFALAWAAGREISLEQAVAEALSEDSLVPLLPRTGDTQE
jgi:predicted ATPase/class 3 adenylate cyclase